MAGMSPNSSDTTPTRAHARRILPTKKRRKRFVIGTVAVIAIAGLASGGAYAVQSSADRQERVAQTAALSDSTGRQHEQLGAYSAVAEAHSDRTASVTLNEANQVLAATQGKADPTALMQVSTSLASFESMPIELVASLTDETKIETVALSAAATEADRVAAEAAAAAAAQAAQAAAAQAAAAEADAAARASKLAGGNTVAAAKATAQALASSKYGWGADQFSCLNQLWQKESGWNYKAYNPSGATGIPQALPGSKMATAGSDWATNATTQIVWGLGYIKASSYGTPCAAWSHSQSFNWY